MSDLFGDLFRYRRMTEAALGGRTAEVLREMKRVPAVIHDPDCPGDRQCRCSERDDRYWGNDDEIEYDD